MSETRSTFFPPVRDRAAATSAGFRFGHVGTHSSRTMMLDELEALLSATPVDAKKIKGEWQKYYHYLLELRERRSGISAVEAADRHDRVIGRELISGR